MKLSDALRMARAAKKLSQRQVAEHLGLKQQAVSEWEKGGGVDQKHWEGVRKLLGIDVSAYSPPTLAEVMLPETSGRRTTITQTAGRQFIASSPGTYSGLGDVTTISGDQPPTAGMITMDLYHLEAEAIEKLRGMAITSRGMFFKAIELYSVVENRLMLLDFVEKLMEEHDRYMDKTGQ